MVELKRQLHAVHEELRRTKHQQQAELEIVEELQAALTSLQLLAILKQYGSSLGLRFVGYREVSIYLSSGNSVRIKTPVLHQQMPFDGRRKRKHSNTIVHLGLDYFGLTSKCSPLLLKRILPLAVLCPSFEVAAQIANCFGIDLYQRLLREKFNDFAQQAIHMREEGLVDEAYKQAGIRIIISIDGGRIRTRKTRRGKRKQGAKRQGFHTNWREPYLITITLFDENGNPVKNVSRLCDGIFDGDMSDWAVEDKSINQVMPEAKIREFWLPGAFNGDHYYHILEPLVALAAAAGATS